jgi:hypothetical protein
MVVSAGLSSFSIGCARAKLIKPDCFSLLMTSNQSYGSSISPSYKSWGEEQIARLLDRNEISYQYEYPIAVFDRGKVRLLYPDFSLPELSLIIEYFGVNGDSEYDGQTRHKIELYKQAGIEGLFLTRDSLRGDWPARIMNQIESILKNRLDRFCGRRKRG